jgi:hypothetical protein
MVCVARVEQNCKALTGESRRVSGYHGEDSRPALSNDFNARLSMLRAKEVRPTIS